MSKRYPEEIHQFILKNYRGITTKKLTIKINKKFKSDYTEEQIKSYKSRFRLWSGVNTKFKKGECRYRTPKGTRNSIKTEFKKGNKPFNTLPIGTVMMKTDGYIYKKIADVRPSRYGWKQLHRLIWEKANGKIPEGYRVVFKDQDKTNMAIDNLTLASKGELAVVNKSKQLTKDPDKNQAYITIAAIKIKLSSIEVQS